MRADIRAAGDLAQPARPWWESRLLIGLVVAATMLPLLYPKIPPLVDLFGHIGRYRVEIDLKNSPFLQQYYVYRWSLNGNLGVDLWVMLMGPIIGIEPAVKLIVLAIPPLTAIGFLWVAREVHGRVPPTAFFALPFIYGFPLMFGFINFVLSVALAFLAFGLWLRLGRQDRTKLRGWLFVPISLIVFFAHTFGWGLLGLMCFSADAVRLHDRGRSWWRAGLDAALHCAVMALPILIMLIWRSETHGGPTTGYFVWRIKWRWLYAALRDRWGYYDIASVALCVPILLYVLFNRKLTLSRHLAFSAIVLAICYALLPRTIFGSAYADMRLVPYLFAVSLLAIRFKAATEFKTGQVLAILGLLFFAVRIAGNTVSFAMAANDQNAKIKAIDLMERGARVASFYSLGCQEWWGVPRNSHLGGLVIERREGFSNDQWLQEGGTLNSMALKYAGPGYFAFDPSEVVRPNNCHDGLHLQINQALARVPRDKFDYVWLNDPPPYDPALVADMKLVWRGPGSVLYRTRP